VFVKGKPARFDRCTFAGNTAVGAAWTIGWTNSVINLVTMINCDVVNQAGVVVVQI
jgi:hypothetical protein